ncbi:MAG: helix-turn-helix transcriptional regulator [Acidobacteriota bacterium]
MSQTVPQAISDPSETHAAHREAILRVLPVMQEQLTESLDLERLADVAIMSPSHFLRTFRELTGVPPVQFLGALRIEVAKRRLIETDDSILDICYEVGWSSLGSFTTRFTQMVGLAPGRFRELGQGFYRDMASLIQVVSTCPLPDGMPLLDAEIERERPGQIVFVGLFDTPIPKGRPISCAVLLDPTQEAFQLAMPREGKIYLFAVGMDPEAEPIDILVGGRAVRSVVGHGPMVLDGSPCDLGRLRLQERNIFDPPMLLALPLLLHEKAAELGHGESAAPS